MQRGLVATHVRYQTLELLRTPMATVPIMVFPGLFYVLFVVPNLADDAGVATIALGSFLAFATLLVALFQFGAGLAEAREKAWDPFVRTLPVRAWQYYGGWVGAGAFFSVLAMLPPAVIAWLFTPASVPFARWPLVAVVLLVGSLPFALIGVIVGSTLSLKAAIPTLNILFFPLAFAGGLFIPPDGLPGFVQRISVYLPTRSWGELVWAAVSGQVPPVAHAAGWAAWTAVLVVVAVRAFRRDQGRRFR